MIKKIFRYYLRYITWIIIIAAFSYVFELSYSSSAKNFLLTIFVALTLGLVLYATK